MTGEGEEKAFVGTDGKEVKLRHSKIITSTPWYADKEDAKPQESSYEAKRDLYESYDPEAYKTVIQSFVKKKAKKRKTNIAADTKDAPIYDSFSRTVQTKSSRDRKDTAHYLEDLNPFGELEFEENDKDLKAAEPMEKSEIP